MRAFDTLRQCLFREIAIWRRLSHPNVLPVLGVSPKLFPLCIITEWMTNGNIMDFASKHPEANRLHLVRRPPVSHTSLRTQTNTEAYRGFSWITVHSLHTHNPQPPQTCWYSPSAAPLLTAEAIPQSNILIDRNCHPRLTDYGLPLQFDLMEGGFHPYNDLQYLAPELLDPSFFGLENRTPSKESDIFAFGMVSYQVSHCFSLHELR